MVNIRNVDSEASYLVFSFFHAKKFFALLPREKNVNEKCYRVYERRPAGAGGGVRDLVQADQADHLSRQDFKGTP